MADIIAAHREHEVKLDHDSYLAVCTGCNWRRRHGGESRHESHAAHVAEELAKAGYGNVQEALLAAAKALFAHAVSNGAGNTAPEIIRVCEPAAAAAIAAADQVDPYRDPEGRALVQAIHQRKAGR